jgi:mRNA interferase MazF
MQKDFDAWNKHKKVINREGVYVFFHPRELWFAHLGANVGFEQDGRGTEFLRPILIVRKFNNEVLWALPLTRTSKPDNPYYANFNYIGFPEVEGAPLLSSVAILTIGRLIFWLPLAGGPKPFVPIIIQQAAERAMKVSTPPLSP